MILPRSAALYSPLPLEDFIPRSTCRLDPITMSLGGLALAGLAGGGVAAATSALSSSGSSPQPTQPQAVPTQAQAVPPQQAPMGGTTLPKPQAPTFLGAAATPPTQSGQKTLLGQ